MITLTITDTNLLTPLDRKRLVAFLSPAVEAILPAETIAPADVPDAGTSFEIPRVTEAKFAVRPIPPAPAPPSIDAAAIFGKALPVPPVTGATDGSAGTSAALVPPVPPLPSAPTDASTSIASPPSSAPAVTAGVPPVGADLDSRGLPWDARIHASTKGKNADGGWKKRKNLEPAVQTAVEAELRRLMGIPIAPAALRLPAGAESVEAGSTPTTFPQLMGWITRLVADKKLTQADVTGIVQPIGMASVVGLNNRPDLIPQVHAEIVAKVAANEAAGV